MDIRVFSKYYKLSLEDKVIPIQCGIDNLHPTMVPNLKIDDGGNETIYLYCLDCGFKMYPGTELYKSILNVLKEKNFYE